MEAVADWVSPEMEAALEDEMEFEGERALESASRPLRRSGRFDWATMIRLVRRAEESFHDGTGSPFLALETLIGDLVERIRTADAEAKRTRRREHRIRKSEHRDSARERNRPGDHHDHRATAMVRQLTAAPAAPPRLLPA